MACFTKYKKSDVNITPALFHYGSSSTQDPYGGKVYIADESKTAVSWTVIFCFDHSGWVPMQQIIQREKGTGKISKQRKTDALFFCPCVSLCTLVPYQKIHHSCYFVLFYFISFPYEVKWIRLQNNLE